MAEFVNGLRVFKPRETAPDFIKASLVANTVELVAWLESNAAGDGTVRFDIKESREGKWYCQKNEYVKRETPKEDVTPDDSPF
jgi:hypothetical protein